MELPSTIKKESVYRNRRRLLALGVAAVGLFSYGGLREFQGAAGVDYTSQQLRAMPTRDVTYRPGLSIGEAVDRVDRDLTSESKYDITQFIEQQSPAGDGISANPRPVVAVPEVPGHIIQAGQDR